MYYIVKVIVERNRFSASICRVNLLIHCAKIDPASVHKLVCDFIKNDKTKKSIRNLVFRTFG